nr:unnamed protein product [Digitaria exilis]
MHDLSWPARRDLYADLHLPGLHLQAWVVEARSYRTTWHGVHPLSFPPCSSRWSPAPASEQGNRERVAGEAKSSTNTGKSTKNGDRIEDQNNQIEHDDSNSLPRCLAEQQLSAPRHSRLEEAAVDEELEEEEEPRSVALELAPGAPPRVAAPLRSVATKGAGRRWRERGRGGGMEEMAAERARGEAREFWMGEAAPPRLCGAPHMIPWVTNHIAGEPDRRTVVNFLLELEPASGEPPVPFSPDFSLHRVRLRLLPACYNTCSNPF